MRLELAERLRCTICGAESLEPHPFELSRDGRCRTGVLLCGGCGAWYPISDHAVDMLPAARAAAGSRRRFFEAERVTLDELGLEPPDTRPDPGFAAQAHQRDHFDDLARRHDRFSYDALGRQPFQRSLRSLQFEQWAPLIRPGSVVLDIGCADGLSTFDIARFDVQAIGLDISEEQIRRACERAEREKIENVSFVVGDADSLPLADGSIAFVLCYGSLHHVPSPERTLREAARVLRPGGSYLGLENNTTPLRPVFDALMRLRPIWLEEAGAEAQMGQADFERWTRGTGLSVETRASVFVPPQLCNALGYRASRRLLRATDRFFQRLPLFRHWGGLIAITGRMLKPVRVARPSSVRGASEEIEPIGSGPRSTWTGQPSPERPSLPAAGS